MQDPVINSIQAEVVILEAAKKWDFLTNKVELIKAFQFLFEKYEKYEKELQKYSAALKEYRDKYEEFSGKTYEELNKYEKKFEDYSNAFDEYKMPDKIDRHILLVIIDVLLLEPSGYQYNEATFNQFTSLLKEAFNPDDITPSVCQKYENLINYTKCRYTYINRQRVEKPYDKFDTITYKAFQQNDLTLLEEHLKSDAIFSIIDELLIKANTHSMGEWISQAFEHNKPEALKLLLNQTIVDIRTLPMIDYIKKAKNIDALSLVENAVKHNNITFLPELLDLKNLEDTQELRILLSNFARGTIITTFPRNATLAEIKETLKNSKNYKLRAIFPFARSTAPVKVSLRKNSIREVSFSKNQVPQIQELKLTVNEKTNSEPNEKINVDLFKEYTKVVLNQHIQHRENSNMPINPLAMLKCLLEKYATSKRRITRKTFCQHFISEISGANPVNWITVLEKYITERIVNNALDPFNTNDHTYILLCVFLHFYTENVNGKAYPQIKKMCDIAQQIYAGSDAGETNLTNIEKIYKHYLHNDKIYHWDDTQLDHKVIEDHLYVIRNKYYPQSFFRLVHKFNPSSTYLDLAKLKSSTKNQQFEVFEVLLNEITDTRTFFNKEIYPSIGAYSALATWAKTYPDITFVLLIEKKILEKVSFFPSSVNFLRGLIGIIKREIKTHIIDLSQAPQCLEAPKLQVAAHVTFFTSTSPPSSVTTEVDKRDPGGSNANFYDATTSDSESCGL